MLYCIYIYYNGSACGRPWGAGKIIATNYIEVTLDEAVLNQLGYRIYRYDFKNFINKNNQRGEITSLYIPSDYFYKGKNYKITKIGSMCFHNCKALTNVYIVNGITEIEENAFIDCKSLMSVTIPDSVRKIGERAFYNCEYLDIVITNSVTQIGNSAFYNVSHIEYHGKAKYNDSWLFGDKYWGAKAMN